MSEMHPLALYVPLAPLAGAVIEKFNGYAGLLHATPAELQSIKGLGPAKRAELLAVIEMARPLCGSGSVTRVSISAYWSKNSGWSCR